MSLKKHRLSTEEFSSTIRKGVNYNSEFFYLKILMNDQGLLKVGVAVSKNLGKKPTQRNYYKRVLRHLLREASLDWQTHYNIILTAKDNIKNVKFNELKQDAIKLLQKTELYK